LPESYWDDDSVSGLPYGEDSSLRYDDNEDSGDTLASADREEDWCDAAGDAYADCCDAVPATGYRQPTTLEILKRQGIRAAINYKCERLCVGAFADMHRDAENHGYSLSRPEYKMPWWFKWASRLESYTRPKRK
jgi:hypothetical protein